MPRHRPRRPGNRSKGGRPPAQFTAKPTQIVDHLLRGSNDVHVVVGPVMLDPTDERPMKRLHFIVATSEAGRGFRADSIIGDEADRASLMVEMFGRRPIVVHDIGDELAMARLCESLWPGERIEAIRRQLEAECAA